MSNPDNTPKHHDLIYDVGLHKGEDAEFYLRKGFRVVAFEANPELIAFCKEKLKDFLNNGQLTIVEGAIVAPHLIRTGQQKVAFYKNCDDSTWGTVCADWAARNAKRNTSSAVLELNAIDFVKEIKAHGVPYFMKIDIEGCDIVCISALKNFEKRPTYVSIESDKTSFWKIKSEINMLSDLGYRSFKAVEQSTIPIRQYPPYPPREGKYASQHFAKGSSGLFGAELEGNWKPKRKILLQYIFIRLGYFLFGDTGIMNKWRFRGAYRLRSWAHGILCHVNHAAVPGWYDTHARHSIKETE
jgi:FkbM family methyltransferase